MDEFLIWTPLMWINTGWIFTRMNIIMLKECVLRWYSKILILMELWYVLSHCYGALSLKACLCMQVYSLTRSFSTHTWFCCSDMSVWLCVLQAASETAPLFPLCYALEKQKLRVKAFCFFFLFLNCLWAPCPLMEASSHGKEGNQINCMSVNRITSSLTCRESGLKLITYAWRNGRIGERLGRGGGQRRRTRRSQGFPSR